MRRKLLMKRVEPEFARMHRESVPPARVEGMFEYGDDVLDEDVWDEVGFAYERAVRMTAITDGVDANDWEESRRWVRYRYVEGDPLVRAAVYFKAIAERPEGPREAPYWHAICMAGNLVHMGPYDLLDCPELDDAEDLLVDRCADLVEAEGIDPEDERALAAWTRRRYDEGDATVRAALLAKATWYAVNDFGRGVLHTVPYDQCEEGMATSSLPAAFWDRDRRRSDGPGGKDASDGTEPDGDGSGAEDCELDWPSRQWDDDGLHFEGRFTSSGLDYEVWSFDGGDGLPRHFHLRRPRSPRKHDVCVAMYEPVYVDHGMGRQVLSRQEIADFIDFLEDANLYDYERLGYEVPDYTQLHWPEEERGQ